MSRGSAKPWMILQILSMSSSTQVITPIVELVTIDMINLRTSATGQAKQESMHPLLTFDDHAIHLKTNGPRWVSLIEMP